MAHSPIIRPAAIPGTVYLFPASQRQLARALAHLQIARTRATRLAREDVDKTMQTKKLEYRTTHIVLTTIFGGVCAAWLYFGPRTQGRVGEILGNGDDLSFVGILSVALAILMSLIFLPHALVALSGRPAIESDGKSLMINMMPTKVIPLSDIESITVEDHQVILVTKQGYRRKINARLLKDHERFFGKMNSEDSLLN